MAKNKPDEKLVGAPSETQPEAAAQTDTGNAEVSSQPSGEQPQPSESANDAADGASAASENMPGADQGEQAIDWQAKFLELDGQVSGLAAIILELDLRGTEDGGACEIAGIRLSELKAAVENAERELADAKRANADKFAERAGKQQKRARNDDAAKDYGRALKGQVDSFDQLPEGEEVTLRFADGDSFLPDAAPIAVLRSHMQRINGRMSYEQPVEFSPEGTRFDLTEAWLLAGGKGIRCSLSMALPVGGGARSMLPAGHLAF